MKYYYKIGLRIFLSVTLAFEKFNALSDELDIDTRASMPSWARAYTESTSGCPCWWDLTKGMECACCKDRGRRLGVPCGYPLHMYCQGKTNWGWGCPGTTKSIT